MSSSSSVKYWIGTVSLEHVMKGVSGGFCQVCHGKKTPLAKMSKGDWLIYYSPKTSLNGETACQKFTAIGKIADEKIYQFKMSDDFIPFRRDVQYVKDVKQVEIRPLLEKLSFIKNKNNWGMQFRFGLFEIPKKDFELISEIMRADANENKDG